MSALHRLVCPEHLLDEKHDRFLSGSICEHPGHFGPRVHNIAVDHLGQHRIALGADHATDFFVLLAAVAIAFASFMVSPFARLASHDVHFPTVIKAPPNSRQV
jgi:hypothetical protein